MRFTRPVLGLGSLALVLPLLFATCSDGNLVAPPTIPQVRDLPESLGYSISDSESVTAVGSVEFVSASSGRANSGSTISLGRPSGLRQGDVMIAQIGTQGAARVNTPTGWTLIRGDYSGTHANSYVFWKRAGASEPSSYSWSISTSSRIAGGIAAYRRVIPDGNPIDAHGGRENAASTNIVAPSITTATEGTYLVGLFSAASEKNETNLSFTPPSGMAERYDLSSQAKGGNQNVVVTHASAALTAAGATGTRTARLSATRPGWGQLVALKPAASTAPPPSESPVAHAGGPYSGSEGTELRFDGRGSSDPNGESLTYHWAFGDGNSGTGQRPWHTYADNGTYAVVLVVTNASGLSSKPDTTAVSIANVAPTASLTLSSTSIQVGESVRLGGSFSDLGSNDAPWAWEIDWGDGTKQSGTSSDQSEPITASRAYTSASTYTVRLSVTDKDGGKGAAQQTLSVTTGTGADVWYTDFSEYTTGQRPSDWSYPYEASGYTVQARTGATGDKVLYVAIESNTLHVLTWDTPGTHLDVEIETVARVTTESNNNLSMGLVVRGAADIKSYYTTRLASTGWQIVKVVNGSVTVLAAAPGGVAPGTWTRQRFRVEAGTLRAKFWSASSAEPSGWTLEVLDEAPLPAGFVGVSAQRAGTRNEFDWVRVTQGGATSPPPASNQPPVAKTGGPYTGNEGTAIVFNGSGSSDPDADAITYSWSFGDGNTGSGVGPSHTYRDNGTYTVILTATAPHGASSQDTTTATIANVAPTASLSLSASSVAVGQSVTATSSFTDPGANDTPWSWEIDWGNGTKQSGTRTSPTGTFSASHTYAAAGTYTVRLSVTDKDGGKGTAQQTLSVTSSTDPDVLYTDFSEYTTGQGPSDWSYPYTVSNYRVEERTGSTGGKVLYNSISSTAYHVLRWDAVGTPADVELETVVRVASGSTHNESMALMARGQSGVQTFYASRLDSGTGLWTLSRYSNGNSGTPLATWSNPFPTGTWVRHRFRVEGNTLRVKLWRADSSEPTTWTLEATVSNPLGSGFAGVWMRRTGAINEFDWVRVTTLSTSSPSDPTPPAPSVAWVWSGGQTAAGATIKTRLTGASTDVRLRISTDSLFRTYTESARTSTAGNDVATFTLSSFAANTRYHYRVVVGSAEDATKQGAFRTLPTPGMGHSFTFALGSCQNTDSNKPIFSHIRDTHPLFWLQNGDIHYRNIAVDDINLFRHAYNRLHDQTNQAALFRSTAFVHVWDDHDGAGGNDTDGTKEGWSAVRAAYRENVPHHTLPAGPGGAIYQSFVVGRVRFIISDLRGERSPKSQADDANKTMLGAAQKQYLKQELAAAKSNRQFIFWVAGIPWIANRSSGADHWGGYDTERREIAAYIESLGIGGQMLMLSGDMHATAIDTGANNAWGGFPVFHAGPVDRSSSTKGGPYTHGPFTNGTLGEQFGLVTITDNGGSSIQITLSGRRNGSEIPGASYQFTLTLNQN